MFPLGCPLAPGSLKPERYEPELRSGCLPNSGCVKAKQSICSDFGYVRSSCRKPSLYEQSWTICEHRRRALGVEEVRLPIKILSKYLFFLLLQIRVVPKKIPPPKLLIRIAAVLKMFTVAIVLLPVFTANYWPGTCTAAYWWSAHTPTIFPTWPSTQGTVSRCILGALLCKCGFSESAGQFSL